MVIRKALLIRPANSAQIDASGRDVTIPLALVQLAACVEDLCRVEILDLDTDRLSAPDTKKAIERSGAHFIGISALFSFAHRQVVETIKIARDALPHAVIVAGGPHATTMPAELMNESPLDYILMGEGEETIRAFVERYDSDGLDSEFHSIPGLVYRKDGTLVFNDRPDHFVEMDAIPLPAYHLVDMAKLTNTARKYIWHPKRMPVAQINTSRGCPAQCVFCCSRFLAGGKWRGKSADRVLQEMEILVTRHGIREFKFDEDNFTLDRQRIVDMCEGIIARGWDISWMTPVIAVYAIDEDLLALMQRAGCYRVCLAVESGSDRVLKEVIHKPLSLAQIYEAMRIVRKLGLESNATFVIGTPGETRQEIRRTVGFAEELETDFLTFCVAIPYPGTPLLEICKKNGYLTRGFDLDMLTAGHGFIETPEFTPYELEIIRRVEWLRLVLGTEKKRARVAALSGMSQMDVDRWITDTRDDIKRVHAKYAAQRNRLPGTVLKYLDTEDFSHYG